MKIATKTILPAILAVILATGCAGGQDVAKNKGKLLVYASFYPIYDLASKAADGLAEVRCLIPDGTEPHDWEPSTRDMAGLSSADVFFYSGAGFEAWVPSVLSGLENAGLKAVDTSQGISLIGDDPHIWLDPANAKLQFAAMIEALKAADPANAEAYEQNRSRWYAEFDKLDAELSQLRDTPKRHIVVTHEAFGYLCRAYDLKQLAAEGYSPNSEPDPAGMARLISEARGYGVEVVFYEEQSSVRTAEAVARELGARTEALSPLECLTEDERANGDDYFSVMRKNLALLLEALQ